MIDDILAKRKHVMEFNEDATPPPRYLIDSLLQRAWQVTPSKNNFMPYKINILGPEHKAEKEHLFQKSLKSEIYANSHNPIENSVDQLILPAYECLSNCAYLLIFTDRMEDRPNPFQQEAWNNGVFHGPMTEEGLRDINDTVATEIGMFATAFCGLCVENNIDVSYTLNFRKNPKVWEDTWFINRRPMLFMSLGTAKVYREDLKKQGYFKGDLKPDYNRIVEWL